MEVRSQRSGFSKTLISETRILKPIMLNSEILISSLQKRMLTVLPQDHSNPELHRFYQLIGDYPKRPGKYLRGLCVLLSCEAHGGSWRNALDVAVALELFQNWVLIHDDIEDDSEERRGQPALHKQTGMPVALNVGDALHAYMWQVLHQASASKEIHHEFLQIIHRTAEGQHLDLSWIAQQRFDIAEQDYLEMVTLKTAYYTVISPLRLGAFCAGVEPNENLTQAGKDLGVAFQIRDDVLNLLPSDTYGKEFAGDLYEAKRTLILARLFTRTHSTEKSEIIKHLVKPRQEKNPRDIEVLLETIQNHQALSYAQSIAEEKAKTGLHLLKDCFAKLPNQAATQELTRLLESLANRNK
jgi:geranylgeranyl diphosphate synthase, type II